MEWSISWGLVNCNNGRFWSAILVAMAGSWNAIRVAMVDSWGVIRVAIVDFWSAIWVILAKFWSGKKKFLRFFSKSDTISCKAKIGSV